MLRRLGLGIGIELAVSFYYYIYSLNHSSSVSTFSWSWSIPRLLGTLDMWHWTHWIRSHCTTHAVHPQNYSPLGQFSIAYTPSRIFCEETSEPRWNQHRYSWIEPGTQKCQCFLQNHCLTRTYLYIKSKLWICTFFMRSGSTEQTKQSSELEINNRRREEKLTVNFFQYILKM